MSTEVRERWEYFTLKMKGTDGLVDSDMNYYGDGGWELISVHKFKAYFKRRVGWQQFDALPPYR